MHMQFFSKKWSLRVILIQINEYHGNKYFCVMYTVISNLRSKLEVADWNFSAQMLIKKTNNKTREKIAKPILIHAW